MRVRDRVLPRALRPVIVLGGKLAHRLGVGRWNVGVTDSYVIHSRREGMQRRDGRRHLLHEHIRLDGLTLAHQHQEYGPATRRMSYST
jgi:hypothetical protein